MLKATDANEFNPDEWNEIRIVGGNEVQYFVGDRLIYTSETTPSATRYWMQAEVYYENTNGVVELICDELTYCCKFILSKQKNIFFNHR